MQYVSSLKFVCLIHEEVSNFWQVLGFLQVLQSWYIWSIVENGLMIHNPSSYIGYLHHIIMFERSQVVE
jgi:hypothetical protein